MKRIEIVLFTLVFFGSGCQKLKEGLFPGNDPKPGVQNASSVCRATPEYLYGKILSDDVPVTTGEISGQDGATETTMICKQDVLCPHSSDICGDPVAAGCQTFTATGATPDGAIVEYNSAVVDVKLGATKGYVIYRIKTDLTCHGG